MAFTLKVASAANLAEAEKKGLHKQFKLSTALSTSNMTLFDEQGRIHKWETPERVLQDFYSLRLALYNKRKLHLSEMLTQDWSKLDNKLRFVLAVVAGQLKIGGRKKAELVQQLQKDGYAAFEPPAKKKAASAEEDDEEEEAKGEAAPGEADAKGRGYDYLLGMALWSLTHERVEVLRAELAAKEAELQALLKKSPKQLWMEDLDAFEAGLQAREGQQPSPWPSPWPQPWPWP